MIVSYQGKESFKISQGDLSIAVNPTNTRSTSDITLISSSEFALPVPAGGDRKGFVVAGPGEYEVRGVGIKGFLSKSGERINTIYMIKFEGMNLCFLGPCTDEALSAEAKENLEDIDILFVPVDTLGSQGAYKVAISLEPSVIIPMHYTSDTLKKFLKEGGAEGAGAQDKLVAKKKDLDGKEGEILILKEE